MSLAVHLMLWNRIIRDFKAYIDIEELIKEPLLGTRISVMLHIVKICRTETPGITHTGKGELVERGMPVTMRVVGKLEFREVNAVGPRTLLVFADLGGMIVPVDVAGDKTTENEKRVLLADEMAGEPDGIVMFVDGAGEADGTMTALEVFSNDKGRVLLAEGKGKLETMNLPVNVAVGKVGGKLVLLADSVGETETLIVPPEVSGDSDAKKLVVFVGRVGEAEGTMTTSERDKLVSVSLGTGISETVLVVSGNIVLTVTVVMPAVTVRLYLVVVSRGLAVRVLVCRHFC